MTARAMTAAGLLLGAFALPAAAEERDEAWVQNRVKQMQESDAAAWRRIPWAASLSDARQASQHENRPVFLFSHDGNLDTGRC
jgi:hypothetical protein